MVTEEEAFGAGIKLTTADQYDDPNDDKIPWDIDSRNGDIASVSGSANLQNCLAFTSSIRLSTILGQTVTVDELADIEAYVMDILGRDDRISGVQDVTAQFGRIRPDPENPSIPLYPGDEIRVDAVVMGEDGQEHQLVFTPEE